MVRIVKFRGKVLEETNTSLEIYEKGEWVSGYYYELNDDKIHEVQSFSLNYVS